MAISKDSEPAWVQTTLSDLLSSPHISLRSLPGMRMGPGPIDLFSTKFNNTFTTDVEAVVAGEQVNREGLKKKLLALQLHYGAPDTIKQWSPEQEDCTSGEDSHGEIHMSFSGVSKYVGKYEVFVTARVVTGDSGRRISSLNLQGEPELFVTPTM